MVAIAAAAAAIAAAAAAVVPMDKQTSFRDLVCWLIHLQSFRSLSLSLPAFSNLSSLPICPSDRCRRFRLPSFCSVWLVVAMCMCCVLVTHAGPFGDDVSAMVSVLIVVEVRFAFSDAIPLYERFSVEFFSLPFISTPSVPNFRRAGTLRVGSG